MTVQRFDQSQVHKFAASRLPVLLLHATGQPVIDIGRWDDRLPPLPRHDWGLVLECEVDQGGEKNWAMTWGEVDPLLRHRMRSRSLHLLVARALETSVMSAEAAVANWAWQSRLN